MRDLPPIDNIDGADIYDPNEVPEYEMPTLESSSPEQKLFAFLYMIRTAEHTLQDAVSGRAYNVFYGGSTFSNMADHPVLTHEKAGVPLSDEMCRNAGLGPGCVSTAAGAYQITRPTWNQFRVAGRWGPYLPNFDRDAQDELARRILWSDGVLPLIEEGSIELAVRKASKRWASLPGSTAKQGGRSMAYALSQFQNGLDLAY